MPRSRRIKYHGDDVYYHLISRTVGQEFYLGSNEKDHLLNLINHYSSLYFVKLIGFCIMDNHFHIIIKSESAVDYSEEEINKRLCNLYKGKIVPNEKRLHLINKLANISEYMKSIKETFSRWYNKRNNRTGYFWGDRYKSIILEKKAAVSHCLAYIDLNPVRAKIIEIPEAYKWNSVYARVNDTKIASSLYFTGLFDEFLITFKKALLLYRKFLYAVGAVKKRLEVQYRWKKLFKMKILSLRGLASIIPQRKSGIFLMDAYWVLKNLLRRCIRYLPVKVSIKKIVRLIKLPCLMKLFLFND